MKILLLIFAKVAHANPRCRALYRGGTRRHVPKSACGARACALQAPRTQVCVRHFGEKWVEA